MVGHLVLAIQFHLSMHVNRTHSSLQHQTGYKCRPLLYMDYHRYLHSLQQTPFPLGTGHIVSTYHWMEVGLIGTVFEGYAGFIREFLR